MQRTCCRCICTGAPRFYSHASLAECPPTHIVRAQAEYQHILTTNVREQSFEDIQAVDLSAPIHGWRQPEYVITFAEALDLVKAAPDKFCFAELKKGVTSEERILIAEAAAKVVKEAGVAPKQVILISFGLDILVHMKALLPSFQYLHLMAPSDPETAMAQVKAALDAGMDGVDLLALPSTVTEELIDYVHERGKRVVVWIYNSKDYDGHPTDTLKNLQVLGKRGLDDFTTDLPPDILATITLGPSELQ